MVRRPAIPKGAGGSAGTDHLPGGPVRTGSPGTVSTAHPKVGGRRISETVADTLIDQLQ